MQRNYFTLRKSHFLEFNNASCVKAHLKKKIFLELRIFNKNWMGSRGNLVNKNLKISNFITF